MTDTNVQPPERDAILDGLVNDYLDAKAAIEKHQTIVDQLADQITQRLGVGGRHEVVPGVGVRVQAPAARFDSKKALELLTDEQLRAISVSKPDSTMARKMLPGVLVEQLQVSTGKPSVRVL